MRLSRIFIGLALSLAVEARPGASWAQDAAVRYTVSIEPIRSVEEAKLEAAAGIDGLSAQTLVRQSEPILQEISGEMTRVFRLENEIRLSVRPVVPGEIASKQSGSSWMGAVYFDGQVFVPVHPGKARDAEALRRTLRHEFVHAVTDALSGRRTPAWLDEGLAQLFEGSQPPAIQRALCGEQIPSLASLGSTFAGFTRDEAHAAYALSLFATRSLVNRFGLSAVRTFLTDLRLYPAGNINDSFLRAFGKSFADFETDIQLQLLKLSCSND